ncbi:MAG TPA: carbon monoxide dehydrogenase subunit G [Burkholderiales bacterium]|nr:carbon monoxide dehydrogenase subunit G [Burkholderiales bacterium]
MEMNGEQRIPATQQQTWEALNDPEVLKACVPGCESIEKLSDTEFQVLMMARVGPVSAKFKGKLTLSDLEPPKAYAIAFEGQGGVAGFGKGGAKVRLEAEGDETVLRYDVKASVGGKLAQIGSRLVDAAAKKIANEFFTAFNAHMAAQGGGAQGHGGGGETHAAGEAHHPEPVPRDRDLPSISDSSAAFFAAGALVVFAVTMATLFG